MGIISTYLFFLGWTDAFSLHSWVPLPMIFGILLFIINAFQILKFRKIVKFDYRVILLLYLFLLSLIVSFIVQIFTIGFHIKGLTHTLSYFGTSLIYFIGIYIAIYNTDYSTEKIYKYISWGVLCVSIIAIIEFLCQNFLDVSFDVLRINVNYEATYSIGGRRFFRARGTIVESGHLAMYLLMFLPFVFHYQFNINKNKIKCILSLFFIILAALLTFSAAGFMDLIIGLFLIIFITVFKVFNKKIKLRYFVLFCIVTLIFVPSFVYLVQTGKVRFYLNGIITKITMKNYSINDFGSRLARWYRSIELYKKSPLLGHGAGILSIIYNTGSTSLYLEILVEIGLIGLVIFLGIMFYHLKIIFKLKSNVRYIYLISFTIVTIHFAAISNYWYPWLWTLFAMIDIEYVKQNRGIYYELNTCYNTRKIVNQKGIFT